MRAAWQHLRLILSDFRKNQGVLLSGAVAYYTLLSMVPLFAILLVALSHLFDEERILQIIRANLKFLVSGEASAITDQVRAFLEHRHVIGGVGGVALLFFSSMAFTVTEKAMGVIFHHRASARRRHFLVSAVIPYVFIVALGAGLILLTVASGILDLIGQDSLHVLGRDFSLAGVSGALLYLLGLLGMASILTALYLVLPVGRVRLPHALVGGVTATALWELVRRFLVFYFARISMVNVLYGSLATTVVVLLTLEALSLILLFGAQVIAHIDELAVAATGAKDKS